MFDSLMYAKKLEEAGLTREQAEVHVQMLTDVVNSNLATRQDLKDLRGDLRAETAGLHAELRALEYRMTIKLGTIVSLAIGVAVTLAKVVG